MRRLILLTGLLTTGAPALVWTARASACECVSTPIYRSDPADGAVGVPLNQALAIEGAFVASSVRLENERGEAVPIELNAGPWPGCPGTSADVIPKTPLQPESRYVLRVDALFPDAVSPPEPSPTIVFTTGTTSLPEISLEVPRVVATVVRDAPAAMCGIGSTVFTCIGTGDTHDVELIVRRGQDVLLRTTTLVQNDGMYALQDVPDCVELRRRSRTGQRSAPHSICGDALRTRAWTAADSTQGSVSCQGGVIGAPTREEADGCALGGGVNGTSAALLFAGLATVSARRRRAHARRPPP